MHPQTVTIKRESTCPTRIKRKKKKKKKKKGRRRILKRLFTRRGQVVPNRPVTRRKASLARAQLHERRQRAKREKEGEESGGGGKKWSILHIQPA